MRALVLLLALAACTPAPPPPEAPEPAAPIETAKAPDPLSQRPTWEDARAAGIDFRAIGQEPGWMLDIYQQNRITLLWDYGDNFVEFPLSAPTYPQEGSTRYETQASGRTLAVTIRRFPCEDAMSGAPYPATVEVVIDGRTLQGCGKSV